MTVIALIEMEKVTGCLYGGADAVVELCTDEA